MTNFREIVDIEPENTIQVEDLDIEHLTVSTPSKNFYFYQCKYTSKASLIAKVMQVYILSIMYVSICNGLSYHCLQQSTASTSTCIRSTLKCWKWRTEAWKTARRPSGAKSSRRSPDRWRANCGSGSNTCNMCPSPANLKSSNWNWRLRSSRPMPLPLFTVGQFLKILPQLPKNGLVETIIVLLHLFHQIKSSFARNVATNWPAPRRGARRRSRSTKGDNSVADLRLTCASSPISIFQSAANFSSTQGHLGPPGRSNILQITDNKRVDFGFFCTVFWLPRLERFLTFSANWTRRPRDPAVRTVRSTVLSRTISSTFLRRQRPSTRLLTTTACHLLR